MISLLVFLKRPVPPYLKFFPVYFFCALILGMRVEWLSNHNRYSTGVSNVWGVIEFCYFFFIVHETIDNKKVRRMILFIILIFASFAYTNIYFIQKKVGFNSVNFTVGCFIIVSLCIYYFVELFQKTEFQPLFKLPSFWIVSGLLFNNVLSFPLFALDNFMETLTRANYDKYRVLFGNIDVINNIVVMLTSVLYSVGFLFWILPRRTTL